jgi:hypothetical protein
VVTADVSMTVVQSGTTVTGIFRINIRSVSNIECQGLVGYGLGEPFTGTVTGSFPNGAGTISFVTPGGGSFTGTYANGRITGTFVDSGDDPVPVVLTRQ